MIPETSYKIDGYSYKSYRITSKNRKFIGLFYNDVIIVSANTDFESVFRVIH